MQKITFILFPVVLFLVVLPVIIIPPQVTGSPDEIIPTRNLMMLGDYTDFIYTNTSVFSEETDTVNTAGVQVSSEGISGISGSLPIPAGLYTLASGPVKENVSPVPEPASLFGRGSVEVNMHTSVQGQGEMIEDRQRYMASGLFNVHVYHEYAG